MDKNTIVEMQVEMMTEYKLKVERANAMPLMSAERKKIMDEAELGVRQFKTKLVKYLYNMIDESLEKVHVERDYHVEKDFEAIGNA